MQDSIIQKYSARLAQLTYDNIYLEAKIEELQNQLTELQTELEQLKQDDTETDKELND